MDIDNTSRPVYQPGTSFECLSWFIHLKKEQVLDPETGKTTERAGFRIGGGIDQDPQHSPYADRGIYITYVYPNSPAERVGLKKHDKILQINNLDCTMATHNEVVKYIHRASNMTIAIDRIRVETGTLL